VINSIDTPPARRDSSGCTPPRWSKARAVLCAYGRKLYGAGSDWGSRYGACSRRKPAINRKWRRLLVTRLWSVLIRYYFNYGSAQIGRSAVLETSRHDPSDQRPSQGFEGSTGAGSIPQHAVPAPAAAGANSYEAVQSCKTPETRPRAVSSGCDPYRNSSFCAPKVPRHDAG